MSNILTNNINPRSGNLITIGGANDKVSIAGTLSYEDVTNIDSVGIITAQSGIRVTGGSVGIASDTPTELLDINGNTTIASNGRVDIYRPTSGASNNAVKIDSNVGTANSTKLTIKTDGKVILGDECPGIQFGTTGSSVGTVVNKTLDDYEEGTFAFQIRDETADDYFVSIPATNQTGNRAEYTRIGNVCHIFILINNAADLAGSYPHTLRINTGGANALAPFPSKYPCAIAAGGFFRGLCTENGDTGAVGDTGMQGPNLVIAGDGRYTGGNYFGLGRTGTGANTAGTDGWINQTWIRTVNRTAAAIIISGSYLIAD